MFQPLINQAKSKYSSFFSFIRSHIFERLEISFHPLDFINGVYEIKKDLVEMTTEKSLTVIDTFDNFFSGYMNDVNFFFLYINNYWFIHRNWREIPNFRCRTSAHILCTHSATFSPEIAILYKFYDHIFADVICACVYVFMYK